MSELLSKARELGQMLLQTEEYKNYEKAQLEFSKDAEAAACFDEYSLYKSEVQSLLKAASTQEERAEILKGFGSRTEELKRRPVIKELADSEKTYYGLVGRVLELVKATATDETDERGGCGGGCSGCSGCK